MRRIDIRTPDAWRSFDLWNGLIALLIPLALAGLWIAGVTPPMSSCCGGSTVATQVPPVAVAKPAPAPAPAVAPVALIAPEVEFVSADGKITLKGKVADDRTKEVLLSDARRTFGDGNVIDKLEVSAGRGPLAWIGSAKQLMSDFREPP